MATTMAIQPAKVVVADGRRWWRCANCGRTLGEVVGRRLVILVKGDEVKLGVVPGLLLDCPRCGEENVLK